jgi:hypothetical protein
MMNGAIRKAAELRAKVSSIAEELKFWREQSAANRRWEKHFSQIHRVATTIDTAAARIEKDLEDCIDNGTIVANARRIERLVIDLHSVWEFFRAKLVLRAAKPFADFLAVADEFAWACYKPALDAIDPMRKEPPLTFFKSDTSPYAIPRDHSYRAWVDNDRLRSTDAVELLKSLPIPVVGIPWFQSRHLPDLLIVAHEVGHHVEELGLNADLLKAVGGAKVMNSHAEAWLTWSGEVFADVFATLAAGPAFTIALVDFLATAPATIAEEARTKKPLGDYPTAYLRILVSVAVLRRTFPDEAKEVEQSWRAMFPTHAMKTWEDDCPLIAQAIVDHGYRNGAFKLSDLGAFGAIEQGHAVDAATAARASMDVDSIDVRELVAATALAFAADPVGFDAGVAGPSPQTRLVERMKASRTAGTRTGAMDDGPQAVADRAAEDRTIGDGLYERLRSLT